MTSPLRIPIDASSSVSGLLDLPPGARALYVLAHGAGAGMTHPFLASVAAGLSERGVATLRYQFPYMERGGKRPDSPAVAQGAVRAAVAEAARLAPRLPLIAGGKSFGGRMTSQAQAAAALPGVVGLAFLGFPLHPPGKPGDDRAAHLFEVRAPMLFLQGTRDEFADLSLLEPLVERLAERAGTGGARLELLPEANHSFHVPARSGRTDAQILADALDRLAAWIDELPRTPRDGA